MKKTHTKIQQTVRDFRRNHHITLPKSTNCGIKLQKQRKDFLYYFYLGYNYWNFISFADFFWLAFVCCLAICAIELIFIFYLLMESKVCFLYFGIYAGLGCKLFRYCGASQACQINYVERRRFSKDFSVRLNDICIFWRRWILFLIFLSKKK